MAPPIKRSRKAEDGTMEKQCSRCAQWKPTDQFHRQLQNGYQWLTSNPDFKQSWAKGTGRLPYKRNEVRLTVSIPEEFYKNLKPWEQMKLLTPAVAGLLSLYGDPENWLLYEGTISPEWVTEIVNNEDLL